MSSDIPVIKKVAWHYVIAQVGLMALLILIIWKLFLTHNLNVAALLGSSIYLLYSFGARYILLRRHRSGIALTARGLFEKAIEEFGASYQFLTRFVWLDKFRFIALLSASAISYREMALCNIAYSSLRLDDLRTAKEFYQRAEAEFPGSEMAKAGLLLTEQLENNNEETK